jgi:hypothetical protein
VYQPTYLAPAADPTIAESRPQRTRSAKRSGGAGLRRLFSLKSALLLAVVLVGGYFGLKAHEDNEARTFRAINEAWEARVKEEKRISMERRATEEAAAAAAAAHAERKATNAQAVERILGIPRPGATAEISYSYPYKGLIFRGTAKFVFSVTVVELNSNKTQAHVKVTNIRRYWNDEPRETDIREMPFEDERSHRFGTPSGWGSTVNLGNMAWVDRGKLENLKD